MGNYKRMRKKLSLGFETVQFIDGEEKEVEFFDLSNYEMMQLKRKFRDIKYDRSANFEKVDFREEDFLVELMFRATGNQLAVSDWKEVKTDLKEIFDKYFNPEKKEKKVKSSDMSEPNQEQKSEA